MQKAQLNTPVIYVMVVFIAVVIVSFGFFAIKNMEKSNTEAQVDDFVLSLQNKLKVNRINVGSVSQETFALPSDVESVCFVDNSEKFSPFVNKELSGKVEVFSDHNLFIEPFERKSPVKLDYLYLDESQNPLCVKVINGKLTINLEGYVNSTKVTSSYEYQKQPECVSVVYNNVPEESIDVVFLGYGYADIETFSNDVSTYVNDVLFEMEPFKSNKDKINIYRVDDFNLDCAVGSWVSCKQYSTNIMASNCPHEYIVILVERNIVADKLNPVRSSAVGNMAKINTADNKFVLVHELGHTIGGLADEYTDPYYETMNIDADDYPNCDREPNACDDWAAITDGCYPGCTKTAYYRPTETSLMRELKVHDYGPVNTKVIIDILNEYGEQSE